MNCSFVNVMGECCCPDSYPSANSQVSPGEQPTVSFSKENGFLSTVLEFQKLYLYLSNGFVKSSPFLGFVIANGL